MFINIIGFVGDEFKDPKVREKAYKDAEKHNKEEWKRVMRVQKLLEGCCKNI